MIVTTLGALAGLILGIVLILFRVAPVYALMFGALMGGLIGGIDLPSTVSFMIEGAQGIMPAVLRILSSGILAGVLIKTGAARVIADTLIARLGARHALSALALSALALTAIGVFIDITVITLAPLALIIAARLGYSKIAILVALIGGGKAGNIISPNPNTIAIASNLKLELVDLMWANIIPALFGLALSIGLAYMVVYKDRKRASLGALNGTDTSVEADIEADIEADKELSGSTPPSFIRAIIGPLVAIGALALRPLFGINIDPLVALPLGGIVGLVAMQRLKEVRECAEYGLSKMIGVAILLLGTGAIAGIIKHSALQSDLAHLLALLDLPIFLLAPLSGILMGAASASTTAGSTIASSMIAPYFQTASTLGGVSALGSGAMIHTGATMLDSLPHGSFFHATAGACRVGVSTRLLVIPYEAAIGLFMTLVCVIMQAVL